MESLITVEIVQDDIKMRVPLAEYRDRLLSEMIGPFLDAVGSVAMTFTRQGFAEKAVPALQTIMQQRSDAIIQSMRDSRRITNVK
jgi:hypothetical protein